MEGKSRQQHEKQPDTQTSSQIQLQPSLELPKPEPLLPDLELPQPDTRNQHGGSGENLNFEALQLAPVGRAKCIYCGANCESMRGIRVHYSACAPKFARPLQEMFPGYWPRPCWVWWAAYGKWYRARATPVSEEDIFNPCWEVTYETGEEEVEMAHVVSFQDPATFLGEVPIVSTPIIEENFRRKAHRLFMPLKLPIAPVTSTYPLKCSPPNISIPLPRRECYIVGSPDYVNAELLPHQISGVNYLIHQFDHAVGCIIADEMGLGKTLQTLTFLA